MSSLLPRVWQRRVAAAVVFATAGGAFASADTYPRQPLDVEHYRFALTLSDTTDQIGGEATVRARWLASGVATVTLDLANATPARTGKGMTVQRVASGGQALTFTHTSDRLVITLPSASREGQVVEVTVIYGGIPADGLQIKPNRHSDRTFFSDNWPNKARHWLPTIDHISDKATMEMDVAAPARPSRRPRLPD